MGIFLSLSLGYNILVSSIYWFLKNFVPYSVLTFVHFLTGIWLEVGGRLQWLLLTESGMLLEQNKLFSNLHLPKYVFIIRSIDFIKMEKENYALTQRLKEAFYKVSLN